MSDDPCPLCGGPLGVLGRLGNLVHLLCRNCGAQFSEEADDNATQTTTEDGE
jgi:hypothetical protein